MDEEIIKKISQITEEEKDILKNHTLITKEKYTDNSEFIINAKKVMGSERQIYYTLHTRFAEFPLHGHDYLEIMYIYKGSITHIFDKKEITLKEGDLLFINKHIIHSIKKAGINDIGVNFIVADSFLKQIIVNLENVPVMADFITENLNKFGSPQYLLFSSKNIFPIRNLLESLIYSLVKEKSDNSILKESFILLFYYLSYYQENFINSVYIKDKKHELKNKINEYISKNYSNASLTSLAVFLNFSPEYLSRLITNMYGCSFKELLIIERMNVAESLLINSSLPVNQIINNVGYENESYFHRIFKEKHGTTPYKWRKIKLKI